MQKKISIGIAIFDKLENISIKEMAKSLYYQWELGDKLCESGLLLIIAIEQKKLYIYTGKHIRNLITLSHVHELIHLIQPLLLKNEYHKAINTFLNGIGNVLKNGTVETEPSLNAVLFLLIIIIILGLLFFYTRYTYKRQEKFNKILQSIEQFRRQKELLSEYNYVSCPMCLEEFYDQETAKLICGHKFCRQCLENVFLYNY